MPSIILSDADCRGSKTSSHEKSRVAPVQTQATPRVKRPLQRPLANFLMEPRGGCAPQIVRDGETTIKIKFAVLRGVKIGGRRGKICPANRPIFLFSWEAPHCLHHCCAKLLLPGRARKDN